MIIGKHSALKGFGLFFYAIITVLVFISIFNGTPWKIVGILNTIINFIVIVLVFAKWSKDSRK